MSVPANITIIQDPSETRHAKNTARLLTLAIPSCQIVTLDGITEWPQTLIKQNQRTVVIYPSENAQPIETLYLASDMSLNEKLAGIEHIILLDGSWRKTRKLWLSYSELQQCTTLTFSNAPSTQYSIRKTTQSHSMSTLEACAYTLEQLFDSDTSVLYALLNAMQSHWQRHEPHTKTNIEDPI